MKRFMIFPVLLVSILAVTPTMALAQDNPMAIVEKYRNALNRGDVDAILAFFADDAVVEAGPVCNRTPCVGKAAIRKRIERMVKRKAKDTIIAIYPSGNVVTSRVEHRMSHLPQSGVERIVKWSIHEIKGGKIVSLRNFWERSDPQTAGWLKSRAKQRKRRAH